MPNAAVPAYLGQDFQEASPGLRFSTYLRVWESDWGIAKSGKSDGFKSASGLNPADQARLGAVRLRQSFLATALQAAGALFTVDAVAVAPFTTGLGNEHPLENGFAFLNPYGLPYLPGSGVKGVLRQAARELASAQWGDTKGWTEDRITYLFGLESENGNTNHQRGALGFWDVLPMLEGYRLQVEVMTPHQSHYYQERLDAKSGGSISPHDSGQPNPINFLTVPPGSKFAFHVQCDVPFLGRHAPDLAAGGWQPLLVAAFEHAFAWLGFGAKTAVGYGAMKEDLDALEQRKHAQEALRTEIERQARIAAQAEMSPEDRDWDRAQDPLSAFEVAFTEAKRAGVFNPGGPFNARRLEFMTLALGWSEPRSRSRAAELLAASATKDWGRPSNKDRWRELQQAIEALKGAR